MASSLRSEGPANDGSTTPHPTLTLGERIRAKLAVAAQHEAEIAKLNRRWIALGVAGYPELEFPARLAAAVGAAARRALLEEAQELGRSIDAGATASTNALLAQVAANTAVLHTVAVQVGVDPAVRTNPVAVVMSPEKFSEMIREATAPLHSAKARGEWLTAAEVAALLGYEESYIAELTRRRGLPYHQPNGPRTRKMYRRSEVEAWAARKGDDHGQA